MKTSVLITAFVAGAGILAAGSTAYFAGYFMHTPPLLPSQSGMAMDHSLMNHASMPSGSQNMNNNSAGDPLDFSSESLLEATQTPIVDLADGSHYELSVSAVQKRIGDKEFTMLAYNGSIPGPVLRVARGSTVNISLTNKLKNLDTTLHSHGVRLDDRFDGVPTSQGGSTQVSVAGGAAVDYIVKFPDYGAFWYHPHIRDDVGQGLGLYGNYIVTDTASGYTNPVNREEYLMLSDLATENGRAMAYASGVTDHALMGRYGDILLVNGSDRYVSSAKAGETVRFYVTNAASARVFNLLIPGAKIKRVGSDMGKYAREEFVDSVLLGPAERSIFEVRFDHMGTYELQQVTPQKTVLLGMITTSNDPIEQDYSESFSRLASQSLSELEMPTDTQKWLDKAPDKNLTLSLAMKGMGAMDHTISMGDQASADGIEWEDNMGAMNAAMTSDTVEWRITDTDAQKTNMDIDWKFKKGDLVKIRIANPANTMHPMQHPFHLHGQRFIVLATDGMPNDNPVWKDTVLVPTGRTVDILADFSNVGRWMAHCHIAEHLHSGMMFGFSVE